MPFGCLAVRDGRVYNSLSDVTDKYEIGQILKAKEFCELCLVKERETDKVYVCKKFLKKDGRKVRKAAKNEIMILKMVNHPNILQLKDTFETRKEYFIIQELATGGDVFDWILDQGNYTERDAANVIRQVLEAVAYLHSLNIVHRNLKLENLMYYTENNHNKVVLRDFYLSKFENGSITEPCGTPEYLAPEVVARHRYGRPVDCWAVGVIMYMLLSGNPPFYDETEEENTDMHNRIIFCRIVAGDFEFDSPYWDDISPAAKDLVCRMMEVDPMLRITAQEALWHEWIAGNGASEKNLKDGVCAQFEKNFAKAKWRELKKAIRVTTFMQRLRAPEAGGGASDGDPEGQDQEAREEGVDVSGEGVTPKSINSVSHKVTVENRPEEDEREERKESEVVTKSGDVKKVAGVISASPVVGVCPASTAELLCEPNALARATGQEPGNGKESLKKKGDGGAKKTATNLGQDKTPSEKKAALNPDPMKIPDSRGTKVIVLEQEVSGIEEKKTASFSETGGRRKMAAVLSHSVDHSGGSAAPATAPSASHDKLMQQHERKGQRGQDTVPSSWCQTQLPEAVAEKTAERGGVGDVSPRVRGGEMEGTGKSNSEFGIPKGKQGGMDYGVSGSSSPGQKKTMSFQEEREAGVPGFGAHYCPTYSPSGGTVFSSLGASSSSDWMMDSVIEQIERQMAAVLEKIEGDMPSLLEQISDCPETKPKSSHSSPLGRPRTRHQSSPPPLPTSPRPPLPTLPHLDIQPPTYPPPPPPTFIHTYTQSVPMQDDRDGQRAETRSGQSPRGGVAGRGL
ncbi:caM kinase-like vesicle-associated, like [Scleropages formosus]|uniref:caM kinase-like vesicle-associated, like n=1 Tax=Scleropages formosus TaxID=113540 RepID=UPI0010FAA4E4|nr:caM kinase-like vesicle-associated protein [Scleropages formosus]